MIVQSIFLAMWEHVKLLKGQSPKNVLYIVFIFVFCETQKKIVWLQVWNDMVIIEIILLKAYLLLDIFKLSVSCLWQIYAHN